MAGFCAALASARHGARTILMHDRPVLGGNASSECRMHICGADRANAFPHLRETGILEELRLTTLAVNPMRNFSVWDLVLYEKVMAEPNLMVLLNCSCLEASMRGRRIESVTGWQLTTQIRHIVRSALVIDCSGDSILAPLTGAAVRKGREGRSAFGESLAPECPDAHTMGLTCMFAARQYTTPQPFVPPPWAFRYTHCEDLPEGVSGHGYWELGYWWIERGGEVDSIADTESIRHELLAIALGVWDHIKNSGRHDAACWAFDWIQFLPSKRESRRYIGDHMLTQSDIETGGRFEDVVAYGGWPMDDHDPAGFDARRLGRPANIFHPSPSPYGIPYRCLYARDVDNLMMAGRNASCTHIAMSSTRVMGTCAVMGQAAGTAAALAVAAGLSPRELGGRIGELQSSLLSDDCYLPGLRRPVSALMRDARLVASTGDPEPVRDGVDRQVGSDPHAWLCPSGGHVDYLFHTLVKVRDCVLILDSGMDQLVASVFQEGFHSLTHLPDCMPRDFRLDILRGDRWIPLNRVVDNSQRQVRLAINELCEGVRFTLERTWRADAARVYGFYLEPEN